MNLRDTLRRLKTARANAQQRGSRDAVLALTVKIRRIESLIGDSINHGY